MQRPYQYQEDELYAIRARLDRRGITQAHLAKVLNRSGGAIGRALIGQRMTLLARIERYLNRLDRQDQNKKIKTAKAA